MTVYGHSFNQYWLMVRKRTVVETFFFLGFLVQLFLLALIFSITRDKLTILGLVTNGNNMARHF